MKRAYSIGLIIIIIIALLIYGGFKAVVYQEVKSMFPYSWNRLDELEITPMVKSFEEDDSVDTEKKILERFQRKYNI